MGNRRETVYLVLTFIATCSGQFTVTTFTSTNYPGPYPDLTQHTYNYNTTAGYVIRFTLSTLDLLTGANCINHHLTFYDGPAAAGNEIVVYSGCDMASLQTYLPFAFSTTGEVAAVTLYSGTVNGIATGFQATYEARAPCGVTLDASTGGFFTSDWYPSSYDDHTDCTWTITTVGSGGIGFPVLTLEDFALEFEATCAYDVVTIYDGDAATGTILWQGCDSIFAGVVSYQATGDTLTVHFRSDYKIKARGFNMTYSSVVPVQTTMNSTIAGVQCERLPTWLSLEYEINQPYSSQTLYYRCIQHYKFDDDSGDDEKTIQCNDVTGEWDDNFVGCVYEMSNKEMKKFLTPVEAKNAKVIGMTFGIIVISLVCGMMILFDWSTLIKSMLKCKLRYDKARGKKDKVQRLTEEDEIGIDKEIKRPENPAFKSHTPGPGIVVTLVPGATKLLAPANQPPATLLTPPSPHQSNELPAVHQVTPPSPRQPIKTPPGTLLTPPSPRQPRTSTPAKQLTPPSPRLSRVNGRLSVASASHVSCSIDQTDASEV